MNALFLLPPFVYGVVLQITTGNSFLIWLSVSTMASWWFLSQREGIDPEQEVTFSGGRVWVGNKRLSIFPFLWSTSLRNRVYSAAFEISPLASVDKDVVFQNQIGVTAMADPVYQPLSSRFPHALLIGPTGSGKTELMKLIATQYQSEIWAIDFKGGAGFSNFPKVSLLVTDLDLDSLDQMLHLFGQRRLQPANTRLLVLVDELSDALLEPRIAALVEQVSRRGRSLNVMLVAADQSLSSVPRVILHNFANRISVGADHADRTLLGFTGEPTPVEGDFLQAELLQGGRQVEFGFIAGTAHEKTASDQSEAANPLLFRVSTRTQ